jgi:hypothetical protein
MEDNNTNVTNNTNTDSEIVTPIIMKQIVQEMINDPKKLESGYSLFTKIEYCRGFYVSLLSIVLDNNSKPSEIKFASTVFLNFIRRNWCDDSFICIEEKMELFAALTSSFLHSDYYISNFIAKILGIISSKEWPNSYEMLIKKIIKGLVESKDPAIVEVYLRIMINILTECDDRIAQMTSELLPVIIDVFKNSNVRIQFIILILNKLLNICNMI